jgi:hypothetical protein
MLPGIDDGAADLSVSMAIAKASVADGLAVAACTPHILSGIFHDSRPKRAPGRDKAEWCDGKCASPSRLPMSAATRSFGWGERDVERDFAEGSHLATEHRPLNGCFGGM